jgi:predicted ribonuclease YlaK
LYEGLIKKELDPKMIDRLYNKDKIKTNMDLYENQFIDSENMICRYKEGFLHKIKWNNNMEGVGKLNRKQIMLSNLLFDKKVTVVSIIGGAGSGKTSLGKTLKNPR